MLTPNSDFWKTAVPRAWDNEPPEYTFDDLCHEDRERIVQLTWEYLDGSAVTEFIAQVLVHHANGNETTIRSEQLWAMLTAKEAQFIQDEIDEVCREVAQKEA